MMRKKTTLMFWITGLCMQLILGNGNPVVAQSLQFGAKGGFSVPRLSGGDTEQSQGFKSRFAPAFGLIAHRTLSSHFGVQVEVLYVGQGGKRDEMQPVPAENLTGLPLPPGVSLYADFKNEAILNYMEIPVLARYRLPVSSSLDAYLAAGPYMGVLLNAKTVTSGMSQLFLDGAGRAPVVDAQGNPLPPMNFDDERSITSDIKKYNFGAAAGIGLALHTSSGLMFVDVRGTTGFTHIQRDERNGKNNTGALVITAGFLYNLRGRGAR
ncbi:MAG: PorT family protein [Calditrichaeota bacterium]|nr:MAG: PorT family protein [Calditrichota bacterium]